MGGSSTHSPLIFWDIFPTYLRMLFQQKKKIANFDQNFGLVPLKVPTNKKNNISFSYLNCNNNNNLFRTRIYTIETNESKGINFLALK